MTEQVAAHLLSAPARRLADELLIDILVRPGCRNDEEFAPAPGEHLLLRAHIAHWVTFTDPDSPTIRLANPYR